MPTPPKTIALTCSLVAFFLALLPAPQDRGQAWAEAVPAPQFSSRNDLVSRWQNARGLPDGTLIEAGGLRYLVEANSRSIPDLPGLRPASPASPRHFADPGAGKDATAALQLAFETGSVQLDPGRIYAFERLHVPPGTTVSGAGATLRYTGPDRNTSALTIGADVTWDVLTYRAAHETKKGAGAIRISDRVTIGKLTLQAEAQLDSNAVVVAGDDVDIASFTSSGFGRPLVVSHPERTLKGFHLGTHRFESVLRGIFLKNLRDFEIGGGTQLGRSPNARREAPGRNNILMSGVSNGDFGAMDLADAAEHAIRFGGGGADESLSSQSIRFGPLTIRRASASAIKINPEVDARVTDIRFERIDVVDPFHETGESAKASQLIRISHADRISVGAGSVSGSASSGPGIIFAIADSRDIEIGPFEVRCCARQLVAFIEDNDWNGSAAYGDIRNIRFTGLEAGGDGVPRGIPIRIDTNKIELAGVVFQDLRLQEVSGKHLVTLKHAPEATGSLRIDGRIGALSGDPLSPTPAGLRIDLALTSQTGDRIVLRE